MRRLGIDTMLLCFCEAKYCNCPDSTIPNCFSHSKCADDEGNTLAASLEKSKENRMKKGSKGQADTQSV